jgi:hypothetical protein
VDAYFPNQAARYLPVAPPFEPYNHCSASGRSRGLRGKQSEVTSEGTVYRKNTKITKVTLKDRGKMRRKMGVKERGGVGV